VQIYWKFLKTQECLCSCSHQPKLGCLQYVLPSHRPAGDPCAPPPPFRLPLRLLLRRPVDRRRSACRIILMRQACVRNDWARPAPSRAASLLRRRPLFRPPRTAGTAVLALSHATLVPVERLAHLYYASPNVRGSAAARLWRAPWAALGASGLQGKGGGGCGHFLGQPLHFALIPAAAATVRAATVVPFRACQNDDGTRSVPSAEQRRCHVKGDGVGDLARRPSKLVTTHPTARPPAPTTQAHRRPCHCC